MYNDFPISGLAEFEGAAAEAGVFKKIDDTSAKGWMATTNFVANLAWLSSKENAAKNKPFGPLQVTFAGLPLEAANKLKTGGEAIKNLVVHQVKQVAQDKYADDKSIKVPTAYVYAMSNFKKYADPSDKTKEVADVTVDFVTDKETATVGLGTEQFQAVFGGSMYMAYVDTSSAA